MDLGNSGTVGPVEPLAKRSSFTAGIFFIAAFTVLYVARDFFMPLALAILLALILAPAVRLLARWKIPTPAGAILVLLAFAGLLVGAGIFLSGPISTWVRKGPEVYDKIEKKTEFITRPIQNLKSSFHRPETQKPDESEPPKVKLEKPGMLKTAVAGAGVVISFAGTTFILLYFLLATGDALLTSIFANLPKPEKRQQALAVGQDIKHHISRYLFTITLINITEGVIISIGMALAGMPTPMLWGAIHALLNFIPYIGAITGLAITTLVSLLTFDSIGRIILPPIIYFAVMALDNFASPMVLGRRLVLNPALVFISLMFWGWLWGIIGIFIAVPMLIALKLICDHVPEWQRYGRILSADKKQEQITSQYRTG